MSENSVMKMFETLFWFKLGLISLELGYRSGMRLKTGVFDDLLLLERSFHLKSEIFPSRLEYPGPFFSSPSIWVNIIIVICRYFENLT